MTHELTDLLARYSPCVHTPKQIGQDFLNIGAGEVLPYFCAERETVIGLPVIPSLEVTVNAHRKPRNIGKRSSLYSSPVRDTLSSGALASKLAPSRLKANVVISRRKGPNKGVVRSSDL